MGVWRPRRGRTLVAGMAVYGSAGREPAMKQLPAAYREPVRTLYAELDALEEIRGEAERALVGDARSFPIAKLLLPVLASEPYGLRRCYPS